MTTQPPHLMCPFQNDALNVVLEHHVDLLAVRLPHPDLLILYCIGALLGKGQQCPPLYVSTDLVNCRCQLMVLLPNV